MQKLQLSIPKPCHENWHNMTPTDQGRFCNACAKEVVDFSAMTDIQVLNYFTNMTHEKVCGRALPEQLDRTISRPAEPKKRLFWYWNYIVMFFMFFGKGNSTKAQSCRAISGGTQVITVAELDKVRQTDVNNALAGKIAGPAVADNRVIAGKITDKDGNPVSFASVKIKGTSTGIYADANGVYSLKINSNSILVISGAGFKEAEVVLGTQSFINTVMEKAGIDIKEVVVTGHRHGSTVSDATFVVKDIKTGMPINKAKLVFIRSSNNEPAITFTDSNGNYQAKRMDVRPYYDVKVMAEGYQSNEFTIEEDDFRNGKKEWEVLLRKKKSEVVKLATPVNVGKETTVRLGGVHVENLNKKVLYVVDGELWNDKSIDLIDIDNIEDVTILQPSNATALFGPDAAAGAIVMTTKKAKEKTLEPVVVKAEYGTMRRSLGGVSSVTVYTTTYWADTKANLATMLNDSLRVYPNPVQRNGTFSIALKLKEIGTYQIQFTDVGGRVILQKQINTTGKNHVEMVSPQNWVAGVYNVRVFNKNKLISKNSFIIE